ncbi:MAG: hypothetical protein V1664_03570 [Candidatus Uhrbacteria bacterium]
MSPQNKIDQEPIKITPKENLGKKPEVFGLPKETVEITPEVLETAGVVESANEAEPIKSAEATEAPPPATPIAITPAVPVLPKDEIVQEIEELLSEDLTDLFLKMKPEDQEAFRLKGEETASKIRVLLSAAKVNVKKILFLICDWLKMIPGVNRFFLEQEAKIKTDKILLSAEDHRQKGKL